MDNLDQKIVPNHVECLNGNKGMWVIHPSVIAQRISEKEFHTLADLSGIVIQPGTSAVVYLDGKEVAQVGSGEYVFANNDEVNRVMNETVVDYQNFTNNNSIPGFIKSGWFKIVRFLTGHKVGEADSHLNSSRKSVNEVVRSLYNSTGSNFSIYLRVNSPFPAIFGYNPYAEGREAFAPMKIRTRILDVDVCVVMLMQIRDFHQFLSYYMTYRSCVSVMDVQKEIERYVRNAVHEVLQSEDVNENGISANAKTMITVRLKELERYLYGIAVVDVPEITCSNKEFDRFRDVAAEMFCSEKELDYLQRSNELKNRLAAINIDAARSDLDTLKAIDEVNKDRLLHDDEMVRFKKSLQLRSEDSQAEMMAESAARKIAINTAIQTKQILAQHDIDELKSDLMFNDGRKALQRQLELDDTLRRHDYMKTLEDAMNEQSLTDIKLGTRGKVDDYERSRRRADALDEINEIKMWQDVAHQGQARMQDMEERAKSSEHNRRMEELSMQQRAAMAEQQAKNEALRIFSTMGADAIAATGIATGVKFDEHSAAAAAAIAGSHHETEALKALLKMREDDHRTAREDMERTEARHRDDISYVLDRTLDSQAHTHAVRMQDMEEKVQDARAMKEEYRNELHHQQTRTDHTQDSALEYTSKVAIEPERHKEKTVQCPVCGKPLPEGASECKVCNTQFVQR